MIDKINTLRRSGYTDRETFKACFPGSISSEDQIILMQHHNLLRYGMNRVDRDYLAEGLRLSKSGYGYGYGEGFGFGSGYGYGFGFGYGEGDGDGYGEGYGEGAGYGAGYGEGAGEDYGFGSGFGSGDGLGDIKLKKAFGVE